MELQPECMNANTKLGFIGPIQAVNAVGPKNAALRTQGDASERLLMSPGAVVLTCRRPAVGIYPKLSMWTRHSFQALTGILSSK